MRYLLSLVLVVVNTVLRGLLIQEFWGWFILSQFRSLPVLSLISAIGLTMFVQAIAPWKVLTERDWAEIKGQDADDRVDLNIQNQLTYVLTVLIFLALGWVIHLFM